MSDLPENCPACGVSFQGQPIPTEYRHLFGEQAYYSRVVALTDRLLDRVTDWLCPDCAHVWPRRPPVIFLDFDGVLNNDAHFEAASAAFEATHDYGALLDPTLGARVQRIADATGAVIVLSTTWRKHFDWPTLAGFLVRIGITAPVVGATPQKFSMYRRGQEIASYLRDNPTDRFVILDDNPDAGAFVPDWRFVNTDPLVGITDEDVDRAIEILRRLY